MSQMTKEKQYNELKERVEKEKQYNELIAMAKNTEEVIKITKIAKIFKKVLLIYSIILACLIFAWPFLGLLLFYRFEQGESLRLFIVIGIVLFIVTVVFVVIRLCLKLKKNNEINRQVNLIRKSLKPIAPTDATTQPDISNQYEMNAVAPTAINNNKPVDQAQDNESGLRKRIATMKKSLL